MGMLKVLNPTTPGQRGAVLFKRDVDKVEPKKSLTVGKKSISGRDSRGRITVRFRGGAAKRKYRIIGFKKKFFDQPGVVQSIEYDPNRTANIALIEYKDGSNEYSISHSEMKKGDIIVSSKSSCEIANGNTMPLSVIPIGSSIYNVEINPMQGAKMIRSAGACGTIIGKENGMVMVRLPSREVRRFNENCLATVGIVSNVLHKNRMIGKAGRSRMMGRRPHVRGVAMNPVDHPHGGGEGKTSGGRHPVSPWGLSAKGKKTRKNKRTEFLIFSKRSKVKR